MHITNKYAPKKVMQPTNGSPLKRTTFGTQASSTNTKTSNYPYMDRDNSLPPDDVPLKKRAIAGLASGGIAGLLTIGALSFAVLPAATLLASGAAVAAACVGGALLLPPKIASQLGIQFGKIFPKRKDSSQA